VRWYQMRVRSWKMRVSSFDCCICRIKFPTGFTYRNLHGFARFPDDSTALVMLARYVPNVAKRSIWDQCKKFILTTDRPTDRPTTSYLGKFKWPYLRKGSSDPLHVWFYGGVFGVGKSNGAISGVTTLNIYVGENNARGVIRLVTI